MSDKVGDLLDSVKKESSFSEANVQYAELSQACRQKLQEWERELNKQGYWNIALVAYQLNSNSP